MELLTTEEMKYAMETYTFRCTKSKNNFGGQHYTKRYSFIIPPSVYEIFKSEILRLKSEGNACELNLRLRFATTRNVKGIISPVLNVFRDINPNPGDKIAKNEDEAIMLLDLCLQELALKVETLKAERLKVQKATIYTLIYDSIYREIQSRKGKSKALETIRRKIEILYNKKDEVEEEIEKLVKQSAHQK